MANVNEQKCPTCGAPLRFDPERGLLVCDYCGATAELGKPETATQGAAIKGGMLYQVYGGPPTQFICCYNLATKKLVWKYDLIEAGIPNEPEGLFIIGDKIYVVDVEKNVYSLPLDMHRPD